MIRYGSKFLGKEQVLLNCDTGAEVGSAYLAGLASGIIRDLNSIDAKIKANYSKVRVNTLNHHIYQKYFAIYKDLYLKTKEEMHTLAHLGL